MTILLMFLALTLSACSKNTPEPAKPVEDKKSSKNSIHGENPRATSPVEGFIAVVKEQKLLDYPDKTIGEVFDAYRHFDNVEWKETQLPKGKVYIDYIGQKKKAVLSEDATKKGIVATGIIVKFVVQPGGKFYVAMVSRTETRTDGNIYVIPLEDKKKVLDAVYSNREIPL